MRKFVLVSIAALLVTACSSEDAAQAPTPPPSPPPPGAAELLATELQGLTLDEYYDAANAALIKRTPETIIWQAIEDVFPLDDVGLNNVSDAYQRETYAMYQVALDALALHDRSILNADEQLTYDVFAWHLQDTVDKLEFIYHDFIATYNIFGIQEDTRQLFTDIHPVTTEQDALDYITRLNQVDDKFAQVSNFLNRQSAAGIIEPQLTLDVAIFYLNDYADGPVNSNPYFTRFVDKLADIPGLSDAVRQNLTESARIAVANSVIPAYRQLRQTMQSLRPNAPTNIGVAQYPGGAAYYDYMLRHHTTTDLSAAEIHQLGLDELQRIHAEMRVIFDQLGYPQNETLQQLFERVRTDGGVIPAAQVKATYEDIIDFAEQNLAEAFDIFPAFDVVVAEDPFGGYYIGPSFDGTRPGAFYAGTMADEAWYLMPSLTFHESVPGHHTQIALSIEQDYPAFRKLFRFTSFVEGWALYAERLAFELGWYDGDPYGNLGRLSYEALRAARLVMDTGIHSMGWTFEQATQFNEDNVGASLGASQGAAARYSVAPGQATAYMIGMLQILDLRQRAMDDLGPLFDLKEFHRVVLTSGAVPLALLDDVIDRYIAEELEAT
jgi:uncharacterized protein (DUF885 family)